MKEQTLKVITERMEALKRLEIKAAKTKLIRMRKLRRFEQILGIDKWTIRKNLKKSNPQLFE